MIHIEPILIHLKETHVFLVIIFNFSAELCRLLKRMYLAHDTGSPHFAVGIEDDKDILEKLPKETGRTVAAVHCKPKENREN